MPAICWIKAVIIISLINYLENEFSQSTTWSIKSEKIVKYPWYPFAFTMFSPPWTTAPLFMEPINISPFARNSQFTYYQNSFQLILHVSAYPYSLTELSAPWSPRCLTHTTHSTTFMSAVEGKHSLMMLEWFQYNNPAACHSQAKPAVEIGVIHSTPKHIYCISMTQHLLSPWQRRGPTVSLASEPGLFVSPTTTWLTGRCSW